MNAEYLTLIPPVAKILGQHGLDAGFIIPTGTAMKKGIMDATWPLREYLALNGFHDFKQQGKGEVHKRVVPIKIVKGPALEAGKMSLYRPKTKDGDPRVWIYGLSKHASPGDLIALIVDQYQLYIVNCTRENLSEQFKNRSTFLGDLAERRDTFKLVATELLGKLREIGAKGYLPSMRLGDTGIGYTLESFLGIRANAKKAPDYKGIELKSGRLGRKRRPASAKLITLFSSIPNWGESQFSARKTLESFGYRDAGTGRLQLYCSVDARQPNTFGFKLDVRPDLDYLVNVNSLRNAKGEDVFLWFLDSLRTSFGNKHRETFWIGATSKMISGVEHFHFVNARHTRNPSISTFERLLATGGICVDLTMSEKGKSAVRDHGYLFRVYGSRFDELFPEVGTYALA